MVISIIHFYLIKLIIYYHLTYTIYNILEELHQNKKYEVDFKEILYVHQFNSTNKYELAVREKNDMFFLHFFDINDLKVIPTQYPVDCSYIDENKIKLIYP